MASSAAVLDRQFVHVALGEVLDAQYSILSTLTRLALACRLAFLSVISIRRLLAFMVSLDRRITAGWSPALRNSI